MCIVLQQTIVKRPLFTSPEQVLREAENLSDFHKYSMPVINIFKDHGQG